MDAAAEQEKTTKRRQIPPEIVEIILMHLPINSLYRFCRVSKSWRSLISEPNFMKKRAAVRDSCRLLMSPHFSRPYNDPDFALTDVSSCPLDSISSDNAVEDAAPTIFPVEGRPILRASYGELLCVEVNNSLYLWNLSINTYKKIPNPSLPSDKVIDEFEHSYGLGYDRVSGDCKVVLLQSYRYSFKLKCELYSLMSDSWKMIDDPPFSGKYMVPPKSVFVGGALHWLILLPKTIIAFDLATEKYGNIAPPEELQVGRTEVSAFGGKLCVCVCWFNRLGIRFVMWIMEEYGIAKSWTKKFDIKNVDGVLLYPYYGSMFQQFIPIAATPLYLFDNGDILFRVCIAEMFNDNGHIQYRAPLGKNYALFMYKGEERRPWKMICSGISDGIVYVEGLFSPLKFVKSNAAEKQLQGR